MKSYYIFIFFILFWLLIVIFCRNNSFEKFKTCNGCIDNGICYNAHPQCRFQEYCLAFDDENGKVHTPCGSNQKNIPINVCIACRDCRYCIDKQNKGKCIPANEFNCKKCPGTYLCYRNQIKNNYVIL